MPQLSPAPWFAIFIFSWLVFLLVIPPKILSHVYPSSPSAQSTQKPEASPWNWPWY